MAAVTASSEQAKEIIEDASQIEENLLDELENEEIPSHIREARLETFRRQTIEYQGLKDQDHGVYTDLVDEKEFLKLTTTVEKCVVHFYHVDFRRCAILDTHFLTITEKYFETKFAKINAEIAKFLVERLKIRVLPTIICFKNGIVIDRIVGFEEIGNTDNFSTAVLEKRLSTSGVIKYEAEEEERKTIFGYKKLQNSNDDSSDDDGY